MTTMERVMIQVSSDTKAKLDRLRLEGYTLSGYVRSLIEKDLATHPTPPQPAIPEPTQGGHSELCGE